MMYLDFEFKANKESIKKMSEQDLSEIESALISGPTLADHALSRYISARSEVDFFKKLYSQIENIDDGKVEDAILYFTRPQENDPLSRSTSTVSNLLDDQRSHMKATLNNWILRERDYRKSLSLAAAKAEKSSVVE